MSKAMRMMQSMGWSEGEGLGRERQGMATPIILQKTDKRTGIIVNAEPLNRPPPQQVSSLSAVPVASQRHTLRAYGTAACLAVFEVNHVECGTVISAA